MESTGYTEIQQNPVANHVHSLDATGSHRSRGGRRHRAGRGTSNARSVDTGTHPPSGDQPSQPAPNASRDGRGRSHRGVRGSSRGSNVNGRHGPHHRSNRSNLHERSMTVQPGARQFGSHLTGTDAAVTTSPLGGGLRADAAEFTPGQPHQQRLIPSQVPMSQPSKSPQTTRHRRRDSSLRSTAPDIATRTHEDIANGLYECSICTSEIARSSKVWSCKTCWTVFHLGCIKQWSKNEGSAVAQPRQADGEALPRQWRCPGCNLPKDDLPNSYTCWCGKESSPRGVAGVPPHSCGQTCAKPRKIPKQCPHPCELTCHAGPCPPCGHMGPVQSCFCGKNSSSRRCIETNYETGWSCAEICGDIMPCGEHTCPKPCHEGLCGACEVIVDGVCYCGKVERPISCNEKEGEKPSQKIELAEDGSSAVKAWTGVFDCGGTCGRTFDCGKHECEQKCHAQDAERSHCPWSPDLISRCPCGKTSLESLAVAPRISCDDPIPNCGQECSKSLPCGHACQKVCHLGSCPPCSRSVEIACRCGRTKTSGICQDSTTGPPLCMRVCKVTLNCGRHDCGEHCCPGEKKASERLALKRKLRPLNNPNGYLQDGFEAEHICMRLCGRLLKCGNHQCPDLCHKGPCGSCREAIFEEISCNCGRTVLQPPLPCGTGPPPCRYQCNRTKTCGHPQVSHNCHGDQEACPKCPFLLEKPCMCGKKTLKNQPCFLADVRCGEVCGKKLRCGFHHCQKPCHRPGECEDANSHCQQLCGKPKKTCGHPCEERCHSPAACKEDKPCQSKLIITCDCQNLKTETKCQASRTSEGNNNKSLKCDDECARLERNHKLALALNIDQSTHQDDHIPYSTETLRLFQDNSKWAQAQERELRIFAADDTAKRLRFKPMQSHQRGFIHALAEDFGLDTESMDPEPHRHVCVFKTPRFVKAPMKSLADCVRIRAATATAAGSSASSATKLLVDNNPFNGFILTGPRFGLTLDELRSGFVSAFATVPTLLFDIEYLPSEEIVLKARPSSVTTTFSPPALETTLKALKPTLATAVSSKKLAASVALCALDPSLNILRREADSDGANSGGWSQVAAKVAVAPRTAPRREGVGSKSSFVVLGRKKAEKEREKDKKKEEEKVVEDWEEEMRRQEREEEEQHGGDRTDGAGAGSGESAKQEEVSDSEKKDKLAEEKNTESTEPSAHSAEQEEPEILSAAPGHDGEQAAL